jgi:glycerol-3-phosphate dehydrogenase
LDKAHPAASSTDIDYLLDEVNKVLVTPLTRADVEGVYAGLRPLLSGESESTSKLSREHTVVSPVPGLVVVAGGKYTTYRVMAKDAVDAALGADAARRPSMTADLPLTGAAARSDLEMLAAGLADEAGLERPVADRLVARHGVAATEVVALGRELDLLRPLGPRLTELEAEVAWAARRELALSLDDVLSRRMRLSMGLSDRGASIAPRVAAILGAEVGWDAARQAAEVDRYLEGARVEYGVPA